MKSRREQDRVNRLPVTTPAETERVRDVYRERRALGERHELAVGVVSHACGISCADVKRIVSDIRTEIEQGRGSRPAHPSQ